MPRKNYLHAILIFTLLLVACETEIKTTSPTIGTTRIVEVSPSPIPTRTLKPIEVEEQPLYLNLIWHQHQPLYYKDADGVYTRPWVRVHATKDYYDMVSTVQKYPDIHVTFNLTPVLIRQLDDFALNGAKDKYWALAEKPVEALTEDEKRFILERFFDVNWQNIISRFPRYQELLDKRGGTSIEQINAALQSFSDDDLRDLQVWFNLAWFDPDFLEQDPLKSLVEKGRNYKEEDKRVIFTEARRIIQQILPVHKELQDAGQIEIITSPYAHPILPLLYDTNLASIGSPGSELPKERFSYPNDAISQLDKAAEVYEDHFGKRPLGLWPSEGAVAQEIVPLVVKAGYRWMASGEPVLANSLGISQFTRDTQDTVQEADQLYRPYFIKDKDGNRVMIVFRDWVLSDKIGFTYSQTPGEIAAQDFIDRLENIRKRLNEENATGPHLVSVILDGENAWEYYPNDGKEFLNALYRKLSESETIRTVTPSEYLEMFPEHPYLENLFPGAWFSANYETWIGDAEENLAWDYLRMTREDLFQYDYLKKKEAPSPEALSKALDFMYLAEGSDWFWWYGSDQDSGQDSYFDQGFRSLLAGVYQSLGVPVPEFVDVPIITKKPVQPEIQFSGLFTPTIDGVVVPETEWANSGVYYALRGSMARAEDLVDSLYYGLDSKMFYIRLDSKIPWSELTEFTIGIYFYSPRLLQTYPFTLATQGSEKKNLIGFRGTNLIEVVRGEDGLSATSYYATSEGWKSSETIEEIKISEKVLEIAIPLSVFGELEPGDDLRLAAILTRQKRDIQWLPVDGPGQVVIPDLGLTTVLIEVNDPERDDYGPGTYTYPTDDVFQEQVFDLKSFTVGYDEDNLVFTFTFYGPVPNPWGSPNNLALQTLDVYVDIDPGQGTGLRMLLPGRNAALVAGNGWEYAIWAEGWTPQFVVNDGGVPKQNASVSFKIIVDPSDSKITIRVPRSAFGEGDPATWGYAAAVLSQDGFPSPGVWRVRDGQEVAAQWRFGGVPAGVTNYTRIFDIPDSGNQQQQLSFPPMKIDVSQLTPDDFCLLELLRVK